MEHELLKILPIVKFIERFKHTDIFTFFTELLKLNEVIYWLSVVQLLIRSSVLEYSSIIYSSHAEFQVIEVIVDITVS